MRGKISAASNLVSVQAFADGCFHCPSTVTLRRAYLQGGWWNKKRV
jgi:hypothetical protein